MASNKNGYWISYKPDGTGVNLYKIENDVDVFRYNNGKWDPADDVFYRFGWDADFDKISDKEAEAIMAS